jgi:hypothetical protein
MELSDALKCYLAGEITDGWFVCEVVEKLPNVSVDEIRTLLADQPALLRGLVDGLFHVAHRDAWFGFSSGTKVVPTPEAREAAEALALALDPEWVGRAWAVEIQRRSEDVRTGNARGLNIQETRALMKMKPDEARAWLAARK